MVINVGINGFGRVGRVVFRTCLDHPDVKIAAINDPAIDVEYICYLMKYDSTHGRLKFNITRDGNKILIDDCQIQVFLEKAPQNVPWHTADVHYVIEASGMFTNMEKASGHLVHKNVKRVIVTAPSIDVPMLILGVNEADIKADMKIVSCGSSTLYCLAPMAKVLEDNYGIEEGFITSIHAMTPSLKPLDGLCLKGKHWRDHRSITQNIIPATIGACKALGRIVPSLQDKLCGLAFRVPITNVSVLDFTVRLKCSTSLQSIAASVEEFSKVTKQTIMKMNTEDVVSSDFIGDRYSCILDLGSSMQLNPGSFKLVCWYENEYSYACRVVDLLMFSEAQFKEQIDCKNRLNFVSYQTMRETMLQKQRKAQSPIYSQMPRYAAEPPGLTQQTSKTNTVNRLDRSSPIINLVNKKSACRTMGTCKIWNDDTNFVRRQNTIHQTTPRAAVRPATNTTTHLLSTQKSPNCLFMRSESPDPIATSTTSCIRAQERLELVKKEFSKMADITENLLKKSYPNTHIDTSQSSKSKDKNDKISSGNSTEIDKNVSNKNAIYPIEIINSSTEETIRITLPDDTNNEHPETNNGKLGSKIEINISYGGLSSMRTEHGKSDYSILDDTSKTIGSSSPICAPVTAIKPQHEPKAQNEKQETTKNEAAPTHDISLKHVFTCHGFQPIEHFMADEAKDVEHIEKECKSESLSKNYEEFNILDQQKEADNIEKVIQFIHADENYQHDDDKTTTDSDKENHDNVSIETEQSYNSKVNENEQNDNGKIDDNVQHVNNYMTENEQTDNDRTGQSLVPVHNQKYTSDIKDNESTNIIQKECSIGTLEPEEIVYFVGSGSTIPQSRKEDIFDKLDSASNSSSSNSLRTDKKKSQIIAITDLTSSLDDLERLDKICKIMEISDELSDILFSSLNGKPSQDDCELKRTKWSFKELCEKVNLDEFCKKVFGK